MRNSKWFKYLALPVVFGLTVATSSLLHAAETEKINVFCVMSKNIEDQMKVASVDLKVKENVETFPLKGHQIHCTLYMTAYPAGKQKEIAKLVKEIADETKEFGINSTGIEVAASDWLFMGLENNEKLQSLCNNVTLKLSPLREKSDYVPAWAKNMPTKVECIKKYGSPNVFTEFNPHLTLLAKSDGTMIRRFKSNCSGEKYDSKIRGQVVAIGYGIADKDGQINKPIAVYKLAPSGYKPSRPFRHQR